jgi:replicative DNA helicase
MRKDDSPEPPHSIEAEQALLGAIFLDNSYLKRCLDFVPDHKMFFRRAHQLIWWAFRNIQGKSIDWLTVSAFLREAGVLESAGGDNYLEEITAGTPIAEGAEQYAVLVRNAYNMREAISVAVNLRTKAYDPTCAPEDVLSSATKALRQLESLASVKPKENPAKDAVEWYKSLTDPDSEDNLICGHPVVDGEAMGFNLGGLSQLMGPSGGGKTYFMHQLIMRMDALYGTKCGMIQGEMRADRLIVRQSAGKRGMRAALKIRYARINGGEPDTIDIERYNRGLLQVQELGPKMYSCPRPDNLTLDTVCDHLQMLTDEGCKFIGVDYLQAIRPKRSGIEGMKDVTQTLKDFAKRNNVHICIISQIITSSARDKKKSAWDLTKWDSSGGSFAINDFDMVASVMRPAYLGGDIGSAVKEIGYWAENVTAMKILKARFGDDNKVAFWKNVNGSAGPELEVPNGGEESLLRIAMRMPAED